MEWSISEVTDRTTENGYAVLLPAFAGLDLSDQVKAFLNAGGCSILLGETRDEYVARKMSPQRVQTENAETLSAVVEQARSQSDELLVAVDQELGGICRLHHLAPQFPPPDTIDDHDPEALLTIFESVARAARKMGINCFLSPILDLVCGENPWLSGRTWSTDPHRVGVVSSSFIKAIQSCGVIAVAKHFPGYSRLVRDPAIDREARNSESPDSFDTAFIPFTQAIESGVEAIMTGPAIVDAFDTTHAASVSPAVISMLRSRFGFKGLVMSDDLDAQAILRGRSIGELAVQALQAGSDLLMIGDVDEQVGEVAAAIIEAVKTGALDENRLTEAASRVRHLVRRYSS